MNDSTPENPKNVPAGTPAEMRLKIAGIGGAATRVIAELARTSRHAAEFLAIDTNAAELDLSRAECPALKTVLIGETSLGGVGAGMDAARGAEAARTSEETLREMLAGTDILVFVAALGRGTGSGASVEIAKIARAAGVFTVCFATTPFSWEGSSFAKRAEAAVEELRSNCNAFVLIENDLVSQIGLAEENRAVCGKISDRWIRTGVSACCGMLLNETGPIREDFAAFRSLFPAAGTRTLFSVGSGEGESAQETALTELSRCPLLKASTSAANFVEKLVVHLRTGTVPAPAFLNETVQRVKDKFGGNDVTLFGYTVDPECGENNVEICVFGATERRENNAPRVARRREDNAPATPGENGVLTLSPYDDPMPKGKNARKVSVPAQGFGATRVRLYNGENLDIPTFLRKRIDLARSLDDAKRGAGAVPGN